MRRRREAPRCHRDWTREDYEIDHLVFEYKPPEYASQCVDVEDAKWHFATWYRGAKAYMSPFLSSLAVPLINQASTLTDVRDMVDIIAQTYREYYEQQEFKQAA